LSHSSYGWSSMFNILDKIEKKTFYNKWFARIVIVAKPKHNKWSYTIFDKNKLNGKKIYIMSRLTKTLLVLCFCPCVCHCVTNARDSQGRILTTSHMGEVAQKWDTWQSLELASRSLKGWNLWTLLDNTRPLPYRDKFKKRALRIKFESKYCVQLVYKVWIHTKEPMGLLYKRIVGLFYYFSTFS
jgi:hypothetical protein